MCRDWEAEANKARADRVVLIRTGAATMRLVELLAGLVCWRPTLDGTLLQCSGRASVQAVQLMHACNLWHLVLAPSG